MELDSLEGMTIANRESANHPGDIATHSQLSLPAIQISQPRLAFAGGIGHLTRGSNRAFEFLRRGIYPSLPEYHSMERGTPAWVFRMIEWLLPNHFGQHQRQYLASARFTQ